MKAKPSALVVFIPGFPKNEQDSVCLPAQQSFIRKLAELYPHLQIIVFSFQYPFEAREYKWHNISVISFGGKNRGGLSRLLLWNRVRRRFKTLQDKYQLRGLLSFWLGECSLVGGSLAKRYQLPFRAWIMGQDAKAGNRYVKKTGATPVELIAISHFIADEMEKNHAVRPAQVIPLGIDPSIYEDESLNRNIDLLGAGSLIPLKQFEIFILLVKQLANENKNIRAVICGNGPERDRLSKMITEHGLTPNIQLTGERSHSEVIELMKRSRILLHPSSYEGFSGVCLEALGAGAHVVSFTNPGSDLPPHWYIAKDESEMLNITRALLTGGLTHEPMVAYSMQFTVRSVMKLFAEKGPADSKHPV